MKCIRPQFLRLHCFVKRVYSWVCDYIRFFRLTMIIYLNIIFLINGFFLYLSYIMEQLLPIHHFHWMWTESHLRVIQIMPKEWLLALISPHDFQRTKRAINGLDSKAFWGLSGVECIRKKKNNIGHKDPSKDLQ